MDKNINIKVKVWRQRGPEVKGAFETYDLQNISQGSSFLEMLDILNEQLVREGKDARCLRTTTAAKVSAVCARSTSMGTPTGPMIASRPVSCTCVASTMATRSPSSLGARPASPSSVTTW